MVREDDLVLAMDKESLFTQSFWVGISRQLPELVDDPEATEQIVDRLIGQYLPVLLKSQSKEDFDRAWLAFWSYLVAPRTTRKPFHLPSKDADRLIAEFQIALSRIGESEGS